MSWFTFKNESIFSSNQKIPLSIIKDRAKLLFIDDQDVELLGTLQTEGWHVEHWKDVQNFRDLEEGKFDLVFLDIGGIGKKYSPDKEGFGVLERLKKVNPSLIIVAYSGQEYDPEKLDFFNLADAKLSKGSGALKAIETIEQLLSEKWTLNELWRDIEVVLTGNQVSSKSTEKLKKDLSNLMKKDGKSESGFRSLFSNLKLGAQTLNFLVNLSLKSVEVADAIHKLKT
jgi:DNA-binding NarL/FixJ family response regulator